jgi:hypothetical protein
MSDVTIKHCGRTLAGDYVAFDIQWEGSVPFEADAGWTMVVTAPDGVETVRLEHRRTAGVATQFVEAAAGRVEMDPDVDLDEGEITARFKADVVGVAVEWPVWTAVLSVDGTDVSSMVVPIS